jgi:hypothetical protein
VRHLLARLAGAHLDVLRHFPAERPKYTGIGAAILSTGVLACASMFFALHNALRLGVLAATACALVWSLVIISIDRALITSLHRSAAWWGYLLRALPRVLLALLLGAIISTPFTLQIFQPEIKAEVAEIHTKNLNAFIAAQRTGDLGRQTAVDRLELQKLQKTISTNGDDQVAGTSAAALVQQQTKDQAAEQKAFDDWQCEMYGGPACKAAGPGPVADAAKQRYLAAKRQVDDDARRIAAARGQDQSGRSAAVKSAASAKAAAQRKVDQDQARLQTELDAFVKQNLADNGLLIQLKALDQVTAKNDTLNAFRILLFLLFMAVEILPVTTKIFITLGPKSTYEEAVEAAEASELLTVQAEAESAQRQRLQELAAMEQVWDQVAEEAADAELRIRRAKLDARANRALGRPRRRWVSIRRSWRMARWRGRPSAMPYAPSAMPQTPYAGGGHHRNPAHAVMQEPSFWTGDGA